MNIDEGCEGEAVIEEETIGFLLIESVAIVPCNFCATFYLDDGPKIWYLENLSIYWHFLMMPQCH